MLQHTFFPLRKNYGHLSVTSVQYPHIHTSLVHIGFVVFIVWLSCSSNFFFLVNNMDCFMIFHCHECQLAGAAVVRYQRLCVLNSRNALLQAWSLEAGDAGVGRLVPSATHGGGTCPRPPSWSSRWLSSPGVCPSSSPCGYHCLNFSSCDNASHFSGIRTDSSDFILS